MALVSGIHLDKREFAERYSGLHTLPVYREYADDGISGTVPLEQRPEGSQLLRDARSGKFDQILVYKLDRLGRETRLILNAVAELEKVGVRVRSMTEEFDTGTATGRLMLTMLSGFASHEREVIRERSLAGTNRKAEAGVWLGGVVPYGYRKEGDKGKGRLVINEEQIPGFELSEAEVVRTIYKMSGIEKKSCQKIADYFNHVGIPWLGKKCPAKNLNGDYVERLVWADIEAFLRDPGEILERLRTRFAMQDGDRARRQKELEGCKARLQEKQAERDRMLGLFRRGRIDEATLDHHLDMIDAEAAGLQAEIEAAKRALSADDRAAQLQSAESLLATLRKSLAGPVSPELKRRIVEVLVERVQADTIERWGVQESKITITYRFSQPNEPAALVLPRQHRLTSRNRVPEKLETLADHLLRRRLTLKLLQRQVAKQIGVDKTSSHNWETNRTKPDLKFMPAIIRFLGYNPLPPPDGWAERLVQGRKLLGLSQKEAARQIGVDPGTAGPVGTR